VDVFWEFGFVDIGLCETVDGSNVVVGSCLGLGLDVFIVLFYVYYDV